MNALTHTGKAKASALQAKYADSGLWPLHSGKEDKNVLCSMSVWGTQTDHQKEEETREDGGGREKE